MTTFLTSLFAFEREFQRCCTDYEELEMYIAWIGDPKNIIPFEHLHLLAKVSTVVGTSFCQSHPKGIEMLMAISPHTRIAKEEKLYHPKVYIFSKGDKKAIFIGSSNFTYQGFCKNIEANVLIEVTSSNEEIVSFEKEVYKWRTKEYSFEPDQKWLSRYTERYNRRRQKLRKAGLDDEMEEEEKASGIISWISEARWDDFIKLIKKQLRKSPFGYEDSLSRKINLFEKCTAELKFPWNVDYFKSIEKRRLIGGIEAHKNSPESYAWLGHVAASGNFRRMLKNGTKKEHEAIVEAMNTIGKLSDPINWTLLKESLETLTALGPTMKVWGRVLAITRPDLFCTISAPHVRKNIAALLGKSEAILEDVEGYLMLVQLIHQSPWFNSKQPTNADDLEIWKRRVAFIDVVFYD
jgi:hypothetical protein